jgi:hypothetical protein
MDAYILLSMGRQGGGFGLSPIAIGEIAAYCDLAGIKDTSQRLYLAEIIVHMDNRYLEWAKDNESGHKRSGTKPKD